MSTLEDQRITKILSLQGDDRDWRDEFTRLQQGDTTLTRQSVGESAIKAIQRLLVFLGYSTASGGGFLIDGDFGRGTNRGIAQFQFEHCHTSTVARKALCYACSHNTARSRIMAIPDTRLDVPTLEKMLHVTLEAITANKVAFGKFNDALFHLNMLHKGQWLDCRQILERYGDAVDAALEIIRAEKNVDIRPEWILSIIKQETSGIARPRFEQHKLSKLNAKHPRADFAELRIQSMSIGLGQIMGFNYRKVGAASAMDMLYSPIEEQLLYVARFIANKKDVVSNDNPCLSEFRALARYYNGPAYEKHFYHERLQRWFREFRSLR